MANDELTLGAEFPSVGQADWLKLVDKVLDGAPFDRKLVTTTYDGLRIQPLYSRADSPGSDATGRPGAAPFVRGREAVGSLVGGWDVRQYHAGTDLDALNRSILVDLERGVRSVVLGPCAITTVDELDRLLDGVYLDIAAVCLDWGPDAARGAELLAALWQRRGIAPEDAVGEIGLDPLGDLARNGWLSCTIDEELRTLATRAHEGATRSPGVIPVRVDACVYAEGGGSNAFEVAAALASGVAYLRAMVAAGMSVHTALNAVTFRLTADTDQFATLTKLRAARRCWARIAQACGAGDGAGMRLHATTSRAIYSRRDPWVNLIRATLACFAAAAGGADAITVLPFGAAAGQWDELGVRLARNTQIILAEESGLQRVLDPAGGSWYVEARTEELAAEAWRRFQAIEASGGMAAALTSGAIAEELASIWDVRRANLARRKDALIGVSEFPDLDETPLTVKESSGPPAAPPEAVLRLAAIPLRRLAAPFEELRDRADRMADGPTGRPSVWLANLGPVAVHTARASFAKNFFEVGGIRAIGNDGFARPEDAVAAFAASRSTRAVICSSDAVYAELATATATALKNAGCATLYLAGNPGDARSAYEAAGIDEFVFLGCDLLDILGRALER